MNAVFVNKLLNDYQQLLQKESKKLSINRCIRENDEVYLMRIIYSAIGHVALASLFDLNDENEDISVTHFKRRIARLFDSYEEMYKPLGWRIKANDFAEEIFKIYLHTGHVYYYAWRLKPALRSSSISNGIELLRGQAPGLDVYRSGLGAYRLASNSQSDLTIETMYHLPEESLADFWKRITRKAHYEAYENEQFEYLQMKYFKSGYWKNTPDSGVTSLARTGNGLYYLYQCVDGEVFYSQLPEWLCANRAYRRLCNACLKANGCMPEIEYECSLQDTRSDISGGLVNIRLGYLMPMEELSLLLLYSWPCDFNQFCLNKNAKGFNVFNRCMTGAVFRTIKPLYEKLGYNFILDINANKTFDMAWDEESIFEEEDEA